MAGLGQTVVTLRFFGDELDPQEITDRLGREPSAGVRKGGIWQTANGRQKVARTGSWRLETMDREPGDLDLHVSELLEGLTHDLDVWHDLTSRFRADVFCGLFMEESNEGQSLSPKMLRALSERNLILDLDIYGPTVED